MQHFLGCSEKGDDLGDAFFQRTRLWSSTVILLQELDEIIYCKTYGLWIFGRGQFEGEMAAGYVVKTLFGLSPDFWGKNRAQVGADVCEPILIAS